MSDLFDPLSWLAAPRADRLVRTLAPAGDLWSVSSYQQLAASVHGVAGFLHDYGVRQDDRVMVVTDDRDVFFRSFYGVLLAGATVVSIPPPPAGRLDRYSGLLRHAARQCGATLMLTDEAHRSRLQDATRDAAPDVTTVVPGHAHGGRSGPRADLPVIQFTSGSSARPRGVRVTWSNLRHNLAALSERMRLSGDDVIATWLPTYHDMGMTGATLAPTSWQMDAWVMTPTQFIRDPLRWLRCFASPTDGGSGSAAGDGPPATVTAAPSFALSLVVRRVAPARLGGLDFGNWRLALLGGERIDPAAVTAFTTRLAPFGFDAGTLQPAYGLAEATLAVTIAPPGRAPRVARVRSATTRLGEPVEVLERGELTPEATTREGSVVISCGTPVPGTAVDLVDESGGLLTEGFIGEIEVRGDSVTSGYVTEAEAVAGATSFDGGVLRTGDVGFVLDGELYVLGRSGDSVSVQGRNIYAEDLEIAARGMFGGQTDDLVILVGGADQPRVVAVREARGGTVAGPEHQEIQDALRGLTGSTVTVLSIAVPRGWVLRTTSGKLRRREMWRILESEALWAAPVPDTATRNPMAAAASVD
jgi:acyl-CoA synthetase (AMP-forming)/AMP-acid ligase II